MRKTEKLALALCCLALAALMAVGAWAVVEKGEVYDQYHDARPAFGYLRYETLAFAPVDKDEADKKAEQQEAAAPVLQAVQEAVTYSGAQAQCPVAEKLRALCLFADSEPYAASVEGSVTFLTYHKLLGKGYLWVTVDQSMTDEAGGTETVWDDALCLVEIDPGEDGSFTVTDLRLAELAAS